MDVDGRVAENASGPGLKFASKCDSFGIDLNRVDD